MNVQISESERSAPFQISATVYAIAEQRREHQRALEGARKRRAQLQIQLVLDFHDAVANIIQPVFGQVSQRVDDAWVYWVRRDRITLVVGDDALFLAIDTAKMRIRLGTDSRGSQAYRTLDLMLVEKIEAHLVEDWVRDFLERI